MQRKIDPRAGPGCDGQQREPAKIVIPAVKLATGETTEGIAYVTLPEPAWAHSMADADAKFIDVDGDSHALLGERPG